MAIRVVSTKLVLCFFVVSYLTNKGICSANEHVDTAKPANRTALTHHIIKTSSLFPSNTCTPVTQVSGAHHREASLKLVHKHGPCSHINKPNNTPSDPLKTLFDQDENRVESIRSRLHSGRKGGSGLHTEALVPAKSGSSMGIGDYIVTLGIGSPSKQLSLIFDTGSPLTWTQCQPCLAHCYPQKEPIFKPSESDSYASIACDSDLCNAIEAATGFSGCIKSSCGYSIKYGDGSYSVGFLSKERVTIGTDAFKDFIIGCGQKNRGTFGSAAGLMGLSRDPLSIPAQTAHRYRLRFSYCLPSSPASAGFLAFGSRNPQKPKPRRRPVYTPLSELTEDTEFYGLDMTGISVAGAKLPVPSSVFASGTIIDSGTVITRLPPGAYEELRKAVRRAMSGYPSAGEYSKLDTCYDLSGYEVVSVPRISFFFSGGVEVESDVAGILVPVSERQVCFAFIGNSEAEAVGIFGNNQQKTWEVVHDNAGRGRVGFGASACS